MNMKTRSEKVEEWERKVRIKRIAVSVLINAFFVCVFVVFVLLVRQSQYDFVTQTCFIETDSGKYVPYNQFRSFDVSQ